MSIEEVTEEGWLDRIKGAFGGMIFGGLLILAAPMALWWNEGRAVQTAKSLDEGLGAVVEVKADKVDNANDKKLVHLSGDTVTKDVLKDTQFGISATAIKLERRVEMYQWKENVETKTEKKAGGKKKTTKTYTYEKAWSSSHINSSNFKDSNKYVNPASMPFGNKMSQAQTVTLGAFKLSDGLIGKIGGWKDLPATDETLAKLPPAIKARASLDGSQIYITTVKGPKPAEPLVGDVRVSFQIVEPTKVSVVAQQVGDTFQPYQTQAGDQLEMLKAGVVGSQQMFADAQAANVTMTWILRFVGFLMFLIGFNLLFKPLEVIADFIPFVGSIVGAGGFVVALLLASGLSFITIAIAWIFYRPLIGIPMLIAGIALPVFLIIKNKKEAAEPKAAA